MNYTPPPFQHIHFLPPSTEPSTRTLPVHSVNLVAHAPLDGGANHWCFYLRTSSHASTSLDMTPTHSVPSTILPRGSKGHILISALPSPGPEEATKTVSLAVRRGLTVGEVVDLLVREGRERYEFNEEGRGCRMWCSEVVSLFEREGVVTDKKEAEEARRAIGVEFPSGRKVPLDVGAYY